MASTKYDRVRVQGRVLDKMTAQFHQRVSDKMQKDCGVRPIIVQGSYNTSVSASAGTHNGGGAIDYSVRNLTRSQALHLVKCCRFYGGAAWYRTSPPFSGPHVHVIVIGNDRAHSSAKNQVASYKRHRNGLAGDGYDPFWRPKKIAAFKYVEPRKAPKPKPKTTKRLDGGKVNQRWKVRRGAEAHFRFKPASNSTVATRKKSGEWRIVEWIVVLDIDGKKRKYLKTDSGRWVNAGTMTRIR